MKIFKDLNDWLAFRKAKSCSELGFAPTMGNLHDGHASLFLTSQKENERTVSSLFVNPAQFNNPDDFTQYPRTLEDDLEKMEQFGVDFCILPDEQAIYPDAYRYRILENFLSVCLEGEHRPGHFQGMLTVVMKLLNITRPRRAYFGEKDFQQFLLIQGMVDAFFLDVEIKLCPTIREKSGLAYSSRNNRLNSEQRRLAEEFARIFHQKSKTCEQIATELSSKNIRVEYIKDYQDRRFAAVFIGEVRLIDTYDLAKSFICPV